MKSVLAIFLGLLISPIALAQEPDLSKEKIKFSRITKNFQKVPIHLDLGTTVYKNKDGVQVDLIPEIHIADAAHYERRNEQFKAYNSLCYELVAPKGTVPEKQENRGVGLHSMQTIMSDMMGLSHQLSIVDYKAKNMVHADMSFEEMLKKAGDRGDDQVTIMLGAFADMIRQQNLAKLKGSPEDSLTFDFIMKSLTNPNYLKRYIAQQILSNDQIGPTIEQLLVKDRNEAAMKVVMERVKAGDKKIGLYYGAAHMPDFDLKLRALGFEPVKQEWEEAWDMRITADEVMRMQIENQLKKAIGDR